MSLRLGGHMICLNYHIYKHYRALSKISITSFLVLRYLFYLQERSRKISILASCPAACRCATYFYLVLFYLPGPEMSTHRGLPFAPKSQIITWRTVRTRGMLQLWASQSLLPGRQSQFGNHRRGIISPGNELLPVRDLPVVRPRLRGRAAIERHFKPAKDKQNAGSGCLSSRQQLVYPELSSYRQSFTNAR